MTTTPVFLAWKIPWTEEPGGLQSMGFSRQEHWSCHFLLQRIFLTQGSNPGLLHCRLILYPLSYHRSPLPSSNQQSSLCLCGFYFVLFGFWVLGLPGGSDSKEPACNAGDPGLIPGSERSPGEGNGYPLQCSCLENPMDRGAWWTMGSAAKSWT